MRNARHLYRRRQHAGNRRGWRNGSSSFPLDIPKSCEKSSCGCGSIPKRAQLWVSRTSSVLLDKFTLAASCRALFTHLRWIARVSGTSCRSNTLLG